jgi:peptidoglycan/LPS O-acetylase OafA/YrhL
MTAQPAAARAHSHLLGIDALRFLAALMVMLFHFGYWNWAHHGGVTYYLIGSVTSFPRMAPWTQWGSVGVQIFFVISGYVIALSAQNASSYQFIVSRMVRLVPAVWICAPITFVALQILPSIPRWEMVRALLHSLFFWPFEPYIDGSYWTLGVEVSFYSMVLVLLIARRFYAIKALALVFGIASTAFGLLIANASISGNTALLDHLLGLRDSRAFDLLLVSDGCEFALGVFLWLQFSKRSSASHIAWMATFALGSCLNIYANTLSQNADLSTDSSAFTPIAIWLAAMALLVWSISSRVNAAAYPSWISVFLRRVGLMTYPLYLFHQVTGALMQRLLVDWGLSGNAALSASVALSIGASWYISAQLEPPLQLTRRILQSIKVFVESKRTRLPAVS